MQKISTKQLVLCAILACISGLLSGPLSFYFETWKISFGSVFVILAGILCGPVLGGMTGFVADFINFSFAPRGFYNPLFGITFGLMGVIAGLMYKRESGITPSLGKNVFIVIVCQIVCSFVLNSAIQIMFFGAPPVIFITRLANNLIMIPINIAALQLLLKPKFVTSAKLIS